MALDSMADQLESFKGQRVLSNNGDNNAFKGILSMFEFWLLVGGLLIAFCEFLIELVVWHRE